MDWTTLGNILRSKLMGEVRMARYCMSQWLRFYIQVLLASYVDTKHCERKVDFEVDTDWKLV